MRKLINLWIGLFYNRLRNMNKSIITGINKLTSSCVESAPLNLKRKCRTLDFISVWKTIEFSLFLLYFGSIILKNFLPLPS